MLRRLFTISIFIVGLSQISVSQSLNEKFEELQAKKDEAGQQTLLVSWEKSSPDDPELYVAYAKYYFAKSKSEVLTLSNVPQGKDSLMMTKTDDPNSAAYINSQMVFDETNFRLGVNYLENGIAKFPNRLDMRFGKTHVFGQKREFQNFAKEIVRTIDYSNVNKNQWLWMENKAVENPEKFMLSAIQDYVVQLYDAGDEHAEKIKVIAESVLKYYPGNIENLSNLSVFYMMKKDFDSALVSLLKAEKLDPQDYIVLNNIAWCYRNKGDKLKAIKYYRLVVKYGGPDARAQAELRLRELDKLKQ